MNVRIANTNVRTNTGTSGCVGPPLKESWSFNIRSIPIYTLRIVFTDTGFDPESVSRCKLQSLSLKSYIGSHSEALTPLQPSSLVPGTEDTGPRELLPYPGSCPHTGMSPPDRFPGKVADYTNHGKNCSPIRVTQLPCDLNRYAEVPFIPSLLNTTKRGLRPMPDPGNTKETRGYQV